MHLNSWKSKTAYAAFQRKWTRDALDPSLLQIFKCNDPDENSHLQTHACTQLIFIEHLMYAKYFLGAALDSGSELINRLMYMSGDDKA